VLRVTRLTKKSLPLCYCLRMRNRVECFFVFKRPLGHGQTKNSYLEFVTGRMQRQIFVIDDDEQVCQAIRRTLEREGWEVTTFSRAADCLNSPRLENCDLVISDVKMPGMDGMKLLDELKHRVPWLPVVMMTAFGDVPMAARAFKKRTVVDFFEKPVKREALLSAVKAAIGRRGPRDPLLGKALSKAERRVLLLLLEGKSNKEAAHMLARSVRTVEVHRGRIMKKLGVDNLVDLVKAAYATGLAEPPS